MARIERQIDRRDCDDRKSLYRQLIRRYSFYLGRRTVQRPAIMFTRMHVHVTLSTRCVCTCMLVALHLPVFNDTRRDAVVTFRHVLIALRRAAVPLFFVTEMSGLCFYTRILTMKLQLQRNGGVFSFDNRKSFYNYSISFDSSLNYPLDFP